MWALAAPASPASSGLGAGPPRGLLAALALGLAACTALVLAGALPRTTAAAAAVAAGLAALLGTALAWATPDPRRASRRALAAAALLGGAAAAARVVDAGAVAWLLVPLWLGWLARGGELAALGLGRRPPLGALIAGVAFGTALGAHLLLTASVTPGWQVRLFPLAPRLAAVAYDLGGNVLATEAFFRGALFARVLRRWSWGAAVLVCTAGSVARYLVDPLVPGRLEVLVGVVFYVALLGVGNAWLVARSGSLAPALAASLVFFLAYRLLAGG